jgi:hypothetical protein
MPAINLTLRQKEVLTGLVIFLVFFASLGAGELGLRLIQLVRFGTETTVERSDRFFVDPATGLRLPLPNSAHGRIRYNSLGYRGPELEVPKPPGTVRIAYVGNSTTLDPYAGESENWPHIASAVVQSLAHGCRIDYLNAGLPGAHTGRMRQYFDSYIAKAQPDIVVILPRDINEDADNLAIARKIHNGVHYEPSWLARRSVLWGKLEKNAVVIKRMRAANREEGKLAFHPEELSEDFELRLSALVKAVQDVGAEPVLLGITGQLRRGQDPDQQVRAASTILLYMPYLSIEGYLNAEDEFNRVITEVASETGAPLIASHLSVPADSHNFADSLHFSPAGSKFAGEAIGRELTRIPEIAALLSECAHEGRLAVQNLR